MSNRDSLGFGELLPQDVVDIFAQEKLSKKGHKQRSRSFGRALGWFKAKKNKNVGAKAQNPGLRPAFDMAMDRGPAGYQGAPKGAQKSGKQGHQQGNSHAVPKRDDSDDKTPAPIVLQENVFIEVSRPKYLEDLHSEALEGLKLMQQEERIIGPEYGDNESTISSVSVRAEVDGGGFTTDSTIPDTSSTVSMQSSVSSRSSRSGLTRQGSTFRPLNSGKKSDKGRMRRRHRKTIGSIPQHLQREFGLDRAEWAVRPQSEEEFVNGDRDVPQLALHSPPEANNTEVIHPLSSVKEEQLCAAQTAHVDDMALLQRLGPAQSGGDRPWSLAVPGMTTAGSGQPGPPSPVMSMSPQAAYLSKIIPNAVLPPSIEVVEISRGNSRNSVRTVSKSSLVLSSPTSSRASSRASTARSTSSRSSTITSASRQNHFHLSDSSCWSNSDSDTLVSDSSTISSSSTPRQTEAQDKAISKKQNKVGDSPRYPFNGKIIKGNESKKDGQFARSLSVMKSKRAPPPPSRSYSLHNKMKRRSRDLADIKIIPCQTSEENMKKVIDSPGYNADTSSLDECSGSKTPSPLKSLQTVDYTQNNASTDASNAKKEAVQVNNHCKVISPSSGYSSQDATSPKNQIPKHKKGLLAKLHKLFPATTSADLPTSAQPETSKTSNAPVRTVSDKPSVKALRELFTIPPHPKVHAPPPPPPEVWSQSPLSIELLLGPPAPGNTYAIVKKNPKDKRPYRPPASTSAEGSVRGEEQKQTNSITVESKKVHVSQEGILNVANRTNDCERLIQKNVDMKEHGKVQVSEILNSVLMRAVDRDTDRLPAIAEEHKTSTQNTKNPSISSAHISPRLPTKQTADVPTVISLQQVTSPESSWPPPPPPVSQTGTGSPDETDFPLPPPPVFTVAEIAIPVLVPPDKPVPNASTSLQGNKAPPLHIPPPPSYTAPPPPIKTGTEKVKLFSPQFKDVSPPPSKILLPPKEVVTPFKISKPSPPALAPKQISHVATETLPPTPAQSTPPAPKLVAIPPPPEAPPAPPQKLQVNIIPSKIIHAPSTKPSLLPSKSEVPPPPTPSKEVVVPSIVADVPTLPPPTVSTLPHKDVPPNAEEITSEPTSSSQSVTNLNCPPGSEIITEIFIPAPKHIPPPPPIVSKPPSEDVSRPDPVEGVSPSKPSPPSKAAHSLAVEVLSLPVEVDPEVSNPPPEAVSTPQTEVTQSPVEIPSPAEVSIQQAEVIQSPVEIPSPAEVSIPQTEDIQSPVEIPSPAEVSIPQTEDIQSPVEIPSPAEVSIPQTEDIQSPVEIPSPAEVSIPQTEDIQSPVEIPSPAEVSIPQTEVIQSPVEIPSPAEVSIPQTEVIQSPVEIPSPAEVSIPQTEDVSQPLVEELSRPQEVEPIEMCVQSINDISPEPPVEVPSEAPPSPKDVSPPIGTFSPPVEVAPTPPEEISPSSKEASSPEIVVKEAAEPQAIEDLPPSVVEERFLPVVVDVSYPMLSEESSTDAVEEALEDSQKTSEEKESSPADEVSAPQAEMKLSEEEILNKNDSSLPPWKSILTPPQSIPPPPPAEQPTSDTLPSHEPNKPEEITSQPEPHKPDKVLSQPEVPPPTKSSSPQEEADTILVPSPPTEEVPKLEPASDTAEQQSKEPAHASITEEVSQNANSSNDQALNGCPESPKTEEAKPKDEEETTTQAQTSATNEVPQKPIRKSLVLSSPTSPPAIVTPPEGLSPNSAVPTTSVTRSPPAMAPSMNLQEAIRLRTAARSHNGPSSRLSIHSPPGFDVRKSPTSTASFIFSKSNKKVVIETRSEAKAEKKTQGLATKASEEHTTKKEFKVPPPVAKKPKPKTKEVETGDTEQTAGQDTHSDTIKENIQKPNGSARTVEGT